MSIQYVRTPECIYQQQFGDASKNSKHHNREVSRATYTFVSLSVSSQGSQPKAGCKVRARFLLVQVKNVTRQNKNAHEALKVLFTETLLLLSWKITYFEPHSYYNQSPRHN